MDARKKENWLVKVLRRFILIPIIILLLLPVMVIAWPLAGLAYLYELIRYGECDRWDYGCRADGSCCRRGRKQAA